MCRRRRRFEKQELGTANRSREVYLELYTTLQTLLCNVRECEEFKVYRIQTTPLLRVLAEYYPARASLGIFKIRVLPPEISHCVNIVLPYKYCIGGDPLGYLSFVIR